MLFTDQVPEDKGLFTFYRQQAQNQEQLRLKQKLKKQLKQMHLHPLLEQLPPLSPPKKLNQLKQPTVRKAASLRQTVVKAKPTVFKQRLIESVVDMGQQLEHQRDGSTSNQFISIKIKDTVNPMKSRRYKQKIQDLNPSLQHSTMLAEDESGPNQLKIESFHRRNRSEELTNSRNKPAIHSNRVSVDLPDIRKLQQQKQLQFRARRSIKSRFIQQALRTKDRWKIRNIREYIRGRSSCQWSEQQQNYEYDTHMDSKSFEAFKLHQQRLSSVLQKLKRRL